MPRVAFSFSEEFTSDGAAFFKACADSDLEGMVSKHAAAPYRSGRTKTWLKCKCFTEATFIVVGTDRDPKTGALRALLAHNDDVGLNYAGAAFIALAGDERAQFFKVVDRLTTSWAMFKSSRLTDVRWCHPKLTVVVETSVGKQAPPPRHRERTGVDRPLMLSLALAIARMRQAFEQARSLE